MMKWLPGYFNLVNDNSPELLFPRKKQLSAVDSDSLFWNYIAWTAQKSI